MTLTEMTAHVSKEAGVSLKDARACIDALFDGMVEAVKNGGKCRLGKHIFKLSERAARSGRNPRTGEAIQIPASKAITYRLKLS